MTNQINGYEINETDIESVINYLSIHDPKNADRVYAIQLLITMQELAHELANKDIDTAELLEKALKKSEPSKTTNA
jgi:hypothetical protein